MNSEQKALRACADYARLSAEVKRLTRVIGDSLDQCRGVKGERSAGWDFVAEVTTYHDTPEDQSHLKEAFIFEIDDDNPYSPSRIYKSDSEIREYLSDEAKCPHCMTAYEAIQARKAAKKALGGVKRAISMIGRVENARKAQQIESHRSSKR